MAATDKILIVDDQESARLRTRKVLEEAGYVDIIEVSTAEDAIREYKLKKPDIVFLDIILPGVPGKDILKKILEINPNAKVVIMSVLSRKEYVDNLHELGAVAYFVKPLNSDKLRHIQFALRSI